MDSRVVLLQQNTFIDFTLGYYRWRFSARLASLHSTLQLLYFSWVRSPKAFCFPKYCGSHHLASRWLSLELLWPRRLRLYPLTTLELFSLAHKNEPKSHLQSPDAKENQALHTDALITICLRPRDLETQRAVSLHIPKRSCKIVEMLPCEMHNACPISSTWILLSDYTRALTFLHISSSVASSGRPDLVSSSKDVLLPLDYPTQNLT